MLSEYRDAALGATMAHNAARHARTVRMLKEYRDADPVAPIHQYVVDALVDLRHYAESLGINWSKADRLAADHWSAERDKVQP